MSQRTRCPASDLGRHCTTNTRSGAGCQGLSMSREAVQNLNQHIRVGTAHDGAESCSSKTLRWTAGLRKYRSLATRQRLGNGLSRP